MLPRSGRDAVRRIKEPLLSSKVTKGTTCRRRLRRSDAPGWNVDLRAGRIVAIICPTCQTPEQNAEAEINEATLDYRVDAVGRLAARPKSDDDVAA